MSETKASQPTGSARRRLSWAIPLALIAIVFVANVREHYFLGDDSFISFRYARHLAEGEGLVWNPGERVEGYTNFLWVVMIAGGMRVGLPPEILSNVVGIASGIGLLIALTLFSARQSSWRNPLIWLAPIFLVTSRSFAAWCTGGLATMTFTLLVFLGYAAFVDERRRGDGFCWRSSILFAIASLTRPEGGLFMFVAGLFFLAEILRRRRTFLAGVLWALPYLAVVGAHMLWRFSYYGYWLPNTFYAKVPGTYWEQGFLYLTRFNEEYRIAWLLPILLIPLFRRERFVPALFLTVLGCHLLYVTSIGGDRFEYRFLVFVFPYFYWLIAEGMGRLLVMGARGTTAAALCRLLALLALVGLILLNVRVVFSSPPNNRFGIGALHMIEEYATRRTWEGKFLRGLVERGLLPADTVICVGGAGALPYYSQLPTVDRKGLSDVTIARRPITERGTIAHEREPAYEYLEQRGVVMFDVLNRFVDPPLPGGKLPGRVRHEGRFLPLRAVRVGDRMLVFGSFVDDDAFRRIFARAEILQ